MRFKQPIHMWLVNFTLELGVINSDLMNKTLIKHSYQEKTKIQKDTWMLMFTAALFTIAKTWIKPKCPSTEAWIKKMWHICTMIHYSVIKKQWNNAICSNMDGPRDYIKWSKSERERQIIHGITYM